MKKSYLALLHLPFVGVLLYMAFTTSSVGGDGDTIMHYFLVEQATRNPQYFFDLWGKPFFTLFAFPFVQFGFTGIKVFNIICGSAAVFLTALAAKKLGKKNYWLIPLVAFIAPAFPFYLFSGLTEPFSALVLISVVLLFLHKKPIPAYILASFLPYCRSEAKIFLVIFIIFALVQKHYKYLPLLITGSLLYAVVGSIWHDSFFWIFESPYYSGPSVYGQGRWMHFAERLFVMTALPTFVLLMLGLLKGGYSLFTSSTFRKREMWLVHALFLSMFAAHTTVWALGIYASAGLERVLILVFPLMWLIVLDGINLIVYKLENKPAWKYTVLGAWILFIAGAVIFNRYTRHYHHVATNLSKEQKLVQDSILPYVRQNYPETDFFVTDESYLAIATNQNMKNPERFTNWPPLHAVNWSVLTENSLFLWDDKMVPVHHGVTQEDLKNTPWLTEIKRWQTPYNGKLYILYELTDSPEVLQKQYGDH